MCAPLSWLHFASKIVPTVPTFLNLTRLRYSAKIKNDNKKGGRTENTGKLASFNHHHHHPHDEYTTTTTHSKACRHAP